MEKNQNSNDRLKMPPALAGDILNSLADYVKAQSAF